jgi:hypothetical protein
MKNSCRTTVALILVFITPTVAMAGLESLGRWTDPLVISLPSDNGPVQATTQQLDFIWRRSTNQRLEKHFVTAIAVPSMSLYWLGYGGVVAASERKFFIFNNQIVGVSTQRGDGIAFYPSSEHIKTDNAAAEINAMFTQRLNQFENKRFDIESIRLSLEGVLGAFPFTGVGNALGEPAPVINKIDVGSDTFTIELTGGYENSVPASVTFDTLFKPVNAILRGSQVFPK